MLTAQDLIQALHRLYVHVGIRDILECHFLPADDFISALAVVIKQSG